MDRAYSTNGEKRNSYRILAGKPEGKGPLGRPRCRWMDNIVAYTCKPVARQRPRNKQRLQPLPCNERINKRPFLRNASV
jgi:hypothetical protein